MQPAGGQTATPSRLHLDHVDGVRAIAALVVFLNHSYAHAWNAYLGFFPSGFFAPSRFLLIFGHLSVTVFIVVSGFCLTLPVVHAGGVLRGGVLGFFKRRARRILPPYYAAVALCLVLIYTALYEPTTTLFDVPRQVRDHPRSILVHLLLLQDLFGTSHINYVFWSIAVEWHIYFLMPILVWIWRRFGAATTVACALVAGYALMLGLQGTRVARANPHFVGMFALGMLAAYVARDGTPRFARLRERVPWWLVATVMFVLTVVLVGVWDIGLSEARMHYLDLPVGVMSASLLAATSTAKGGALTRFFSFRPLVFVGTFSYSFYLVHAPLLELLWVYVFRPLGVTPEVLFVSLSTAGLVVILAASYAFFRVFEAPFMGPSRTREAAAPAVLPAP
jgi:peptidoglycan/LPS O-acetylase OafA/YrhL